MDSNDDTQAMAMTSVDPLVLILDRADLVINSFLSPQVGSQVSVHKIEGQIRTVAS